jgi:YjbE family integral membrane protein
MTATLLALAQVVLIDITLAGDNAVVVGMAVAGLPKGRRTKALGFGVAAAALIRVALALVAVRLLGVLGLTLAGGLLLAWVCWRMYRELRAHRAAQALHLPPKRMRDAVLQITLADISMSLDNVLAVAGAARGHPMVLAGGLVLSVLLMGVAARLLVTLLQRHRWVAWIGLVIVAYVAGRMIWDGSFQVGRALGA